MEEEKREHQKTNCFKKRQQQSNFAIMKQPIYLIPPSIAVIVAAIFGQSTIACL